MSNCSQSLMIAASSRGPGERPSTSVNAVFVAAGRAEGTVNVRGFAGCGVAIGVGWSARER